MQQTSFYLLKKKKTKKKCYARTGKHLFVSQQSNTLLIIFTNKSVVANMKIVTDNFNKKKSKIDTLINE